MLAETIGWLKQLEDTYDTALVYASDHGESLGEHGLYLHGVPCAIAPDVQKKVPMLIWASLICALQPKNLRWSLPAHAGWIDREAGLDGSHRDKKAYRTVGFLFR